MVRTVEPYPKVYLTGTEKKMLRAMSSWLRQRAWPIRVRCSENILMMYEAIWRQIGVVPYSRDGDGLLFKGVELVDDESVSFLELFPAVPGMVTFHGHPLFPG